jgi:hypothetical protein
MLLLKIIATCIAFICGFGLYIFAWQRVPTAQKDRRGLMFAMGFLCLVLGLLMLHGPG